jgi:hypothetical protein
MTFASATTARGSEIAEGDVEVELDHLSGVEARFPERLALGVQPGHIRCSGRSWTRTRDLFLIREAL